MIYNSTYMARLPQDEQELEYVPVQEDLDIIAQVVRFVALHDTVLHIEHPGIEHRPGFQIAKSAYRLVGPKLDR